MKGTIGRVVIYAEIDGAVKQIVLPQEQLQILIKMAAGMSDDGKLCVTAAPEMAFVGQKVPRVLA